MVRQHLAAIAILLVGFAGESGCRNRSLAQLTGPDGTAALIDQLRSGGTILTYDPVGRPCASAAATRCPSPSARTTDNRTRKGGLPSEKKKAPAAAAGWRG